MPVKIGLTVSAASIAAGQQATFTCKLGSSGGGHKVAFFVSNGGLIDSKESTANGSGHATWSKIIPANWKPKVSIQCRDEDTAGQPKSDWKDLTVY